MIIKTITERDIKKNTLFSIPVFAISSVIRPALSTDIIPVISDSNFIFTSFSLIALIIEYQAQSWSVKGNGR
jgi:hypothetical protein